MRKPLSKVDALKEIICQWGIHQSVASLKRLRRACNALGLDADEMVEMEVHLWYRNPRTRELYAAYAPSEPTELA